jgi:hypothetical protein
MRKANTKNKARQRDRHIQRPLPVNSMIYKSTWTDSALASGTTGAVSYTISPSISSSSEYSTMQAIFTEVRLLKCYTILSPTQSTNSSVNQSYIAIATNMLFNANSFTQPTNYPSVENSTKVARANSTSTRNFKYDMRVPKKLEFANIVGDNPSPPTPFAGSPGLIVIYGSGFTSSTVYWQVSVTAVFELRGRQ